MLVGEPFYTTLLRKHRGLFNQPSYEDVQSYVENEDYTEQLYLLLDALIARRIIN